MNNALLKVEDVHGRLYELLPNFSEGGQGYVYPVKGLKFAVKLLKEKSQPKREQLREQLAFVRRLDLTGLSIARPLEMLKPPYVGYVMEWLADMHPLERLTAPPRGARLSEWYLRTGGLGRRLRLLARCADILAQLHGRGLVYADCSPRNVLVSSHVKAEEVRLIDADNLQTASAGGATLYTPGYGAPEVVLDKHGVNSLTDAFSFAVVAFCTLCAWHPFVGDMVDDGPPEMIERAYRFEFPWIDHPSGTNVRTLGVPRKSVLSDALRERFARCFDAGLHSSEARPRATDWAEVLDKAANHVLKCQGCGQDYYVNERCCPWCDVPRPAFLYAEIRQWSPDPQENVELRRRRPLNTFALAPKQSVSVTDHMLRAGASRQPHQPLLVIQFDGRDYHASSTDNGKCLALTKDNLTHTITSSPKQLTLEDQVRVDVSERLHRTIKFEIRRAAQ